MSVQGILSFTSNYELKATFILLMYIVNYSSKVYFQSVHKDLALLPQLW